MPEGPLGGPRPFAKDEKVPIKTNTDKAERILQKYVDFLADTFDVPSPNVKVWDDSVWVQVVVDPDNIHANYDNIRQQINLNERDIKFVYVIHEFAHHIAHTSDDIDLLLESLIEQGQRDADVLEGINELQTEKIASEIAENHSVRNNWNQLVALGLGLEEVEL